MDCDIHSAFQEVAGLHPEVHLDPQRGLRPPKGRDQRSELRSREGRRRADAKRFAKQVARGNGKIGLLHRLNGTQRGRIEGLALRCQREQTAKRSSSRATNLLNADGVSDKLNAAAEKPPSVTARVNVTSSP